MALLFFGTFWSFIWSISATILCSSTLVYPRGHCILITDFLLNGSLWYPIQNVYNKLHMLKSLLCCQRLFSPFAAYISSCLGASSVSGFFAAACSLPFDYVKTQIQKMQPDAEGKYPYTGSLDCTLKTLKAGGPLKFYTGFPVYCVRIAPHVMVFYSVTCPVYSNPLFLFFVIFN